MKIKSKIEISSKLEHHSILDSTMLIYQKMESLFPKDFLNLIPHFNQFLTTGLVPPELNSLFDYHSKNYSADHFYLFQLRTEFIKEFGFLLLSENLLNTLSSQLKGQKVLEVGAGTGFLSKKLIEQEINIVAVDYQENKKSSYNFDNKHTQILHTDAIKYLSNQDKSRFSAILMTWPDYESDMAASILEQLHKGQKLYYQGEGSGGCTANDRFFNLLKDKAIINESLTTALQKKSLIWPGLHDTWYVYDIQ